MSDAGNEKYLRTLHAARMAAALVSAADLDAAIAAASRAEAVGPIIDPTLYREKGEALHQDLELLEAAAAFKAAIGRQLLRGLIAGSMKGGAECR